jgi:hypothetical protein
MSGTAIFTGVHAVSSVIAATRRWLANIDVRSKN